MLDFHVDGHIHFAIIFSTDQSVPYELSHIQLHKWHDTYGAQNIYISDKWCKHFIKFIFI